ncbi:NAD-dependent epimerase/dehydratase family protein [Sphingomonas oryzagri]|uniref:SDR family oxidoreductase n=1 Tax=Sphingomonas oryzagri TaxID=3042314 RepID=A0ABT6N494_9SPHN|nr:SDR family oxidoreductase [Sphingomonas oryzagri]MDH7639171.1 SDR family oxidoreductase [Sphingomonas oryzagri]
MKFLITGNMGYVGPSVVKQLRERYPDATIDGVDVAFFAQCLTTRRAIPERHLDRQYFRDVRDLTESDLADYDAVILLAAISNDPMGERFSDITLAINRDAAVEIGYAASRAGVRNLVFASSCSVYGVAEGGARREDDPVNPMTAYAISKIGAEQGLAGIGGDMTITCLRFATACGMSDRLRLDLVLNDFVAGALTTGQITVLSDGTPWRPLIDVADMARAIEWAATRPASNGGRYLVVNAGADSANYQVRDLACAVAGAVEGCTVSINEQAPVDSRSYRVDFSLFAKLAPNHLPQVTLTDSIANLVAGLRDIHFADEDFRTSDFIRLQVLKSLIARGTLSDDFGWADWKPSSKPKVLEEIHA